MAAAARSRSTKTAKATTKSATASSGRHNGAKGGAGRSQKKASAKKAGTSKKASRAKKANTAKKADKADKAVAKKTASAKKKASPKKASATSKKAPAKKASTRKSSAKKASSGARSPRSTSPFPAKWLEKQREALETERSTYLRQATTLQAEADSLVADYEGGDTQFDEESGEGDTMSMERERDLALSAQAQSAIAEIDRALAKFADGTYGICEASGEPIPKERLEAIPWAQVRVEYKTGGFGRR